MSTLLQVFRSFKMIGQIQQFKVAFLRIHGQALLGEIPASGILPPSEIVVPSTSTSSTMLPAEEIPSDQDRWERDGKIWIRRHYLHRTSFFIPTHEPGGPDPPRLDPICYTAVMFNDEASEHFVDEWRTAEVPDLQQPCKGSSVFTETEVSRPSKSFQSLPVLDDGRLDQSASFQPKELPIPDTPSEQEVRTHNLTHLPFRSWCPHCIQGKGKASQHRTLSERSPVIQVDYGFLTVPDSKEQITVMTAIDIITGLSMATVVTSKGANLHAVTELKRFILETGRSFAYLQSDQEPSIKAVLQAVVKQLPGLNL